MKSWVIPDRALAVFEQLVTFAAEIGLVPIPIRKEQNGYIINSLLVPWCTAALDLWCATSATSRASIGPG